MHHVAGKRLSVDAFLRALQRDVAWDFFYGTVNFDSVFGTVNHYGTVDMFAGRFNDAYRKAELDHVENFDSGVIRETFKAMLDDWTNAGFDPFASPAETQTVRCQGRQQPARRSPPCCRRRMVSVGRRRCAPTRHPPAGCSRCASGRARGLSSRLRGQVITYNLYKYISRSDVTWNPSVVSVYKASLLPDQRGALPVFHSNDAWNGSCSSRRDRGTCKTAIPVHRAAGHDEGGRRRSVPAYRHQGYSPKRSMLLVWENASPELPEMIRTGKASVYPVDF